MTITEIGRETVKSLGVQPAILAIMLVNVTFMGGVFYVLREERQRSHDQFKVILDYCFARIPERANADATRH